jgi:hypothetical protein
MGTVNAGRCCKPGGGSGDRPSPRSLSVQDRQEGAVRLSDTKTYRFNVILYDLVVIFEDLGRDVAAVEPGGSRSLR